MRWAGMPGVGQRRDSCVAVLQKSGRFRYTVSIQVDSGAHGVRAGWNAATSEEGWCLMLGAIEVVPEWSQRAGRRQQGEGAWASGDRTRR